MKRQYQEEDYLGQLLSYLATIGFIGLCLFIFLFSQCQGATRTQLARTKEKGLIQHPKDWDSLKNERKKQWMSTIDKY